MKFVHGVRYNIPLLTGRYPDIDWNIDFWIVSLAYPIWHHIYDPFQNPKQYKGLKRFRREHLITNHVIKCESDLPARTLIAKHYKKFYPISRWEYAVMDPEMVLILKCMG